MRAHRQELAFCKLGCLHDHPAIYTQGIVVVQAAYVFPFDLKRHYHIGASLARRRSEGALDIELRHKPEQLFRLSLHNALQPCVYPIWYITAWCNLYMESQAFCSQVRSVPAVLSKVPLTRAQRSGCYATQEMKGVQVWHFYAKSPRSSTRCQLPGLRARHSSPPSLRAEVQDWRRP